MSREHLQAKVDRADELRQTIEREINDYLLGGPFRLRDQLVPDPPRFEVFVEAIDPPPPRLGVLMGDFAHNARCALDHAVWQLALTLHDEPSRRTQFPIEADRSEWPSVARDRLRHVPDEAHPVIEGMQPFHADDPAHHALTALRDLSNEDKHRLLPEAVSIPVAPRPTSFTVHGDDVGEVMDLAMEWGAPYEPGTKVFTAYYTPTGPAPKFHITGAMPMELVFGTDRFPAAGMRAVVAEVRACLDALDPLLPS